VTEEFHHLGWLFMVGRKWRKHDRKMNGKESEKG